MRFLPIAFAAVAALCLAVSASAQRYVPDRFAQVNTQPNQRPVEVRVQYTIRLPLKSDDLAAQTQAMEQGRRMLYEMGANECTLILATLASSCELASFNVQTNAYRQSREEDFINLSGSGQYRIEPKTKP